MLSLPEFVIIRRRNAEIVTLYVRTQNSHVLNLQINARDLNSLVSIDGIPVHSAFQSEEPLTDANLMQFVTFLNSYSRCEGLGTKQSTLQSKKIWQSRGALFTRINNQSSMIGFIDPQIRTDIVRW